MPKSLPKFELLLDGQFDTFQHWVNAAQRRIGGRDMVCVDSKGRRCLTGEEMHRARDEDAFPVYYGWDSTICK